MIPMGNGAGAEQRAIDYVNNKNRSEKFSFRRQQSGHGQDTNENVGETGEQASRPRNGNVK